MNSITIPSPAPWSPTLSDDSQSAATIERLHAEQAQARTRVWRGGLARHIEAAFTSTNVIDDARAIRRLMRPHVLDGAAKRRWRMLGCPACTCHVRGKNCAGDGCEGPLPLPSSVWTDPDGVGRVVVAIDPSQPGEAVTEFFAWAKERGITPEPHELLSYATGGLAFLVDCAPAAGAAT